MFFFFFKVVHIDEYSARDILKTVNGVNLDVMWFKVLEDLVDLFRICPSAVFGHVSLCRFRWSCGACVIRIRSSPVTRRWLWAPQTAVWRSSSSTPRPQGCSPWRLRGVSRCGMSRGTPLWQVNTHLLHHTYSHHIKSQSRLQLLYFKCSLKPYSDANYFSWINSLLCLFVLLICFILLCFKMYLIIFIYI